MGTAGSMVGQGPASTGGEGGFSLMGQPGLGGDPASWGLAAFAVATRVLGPGAEPPGHRVTCGCSTGSLLNLGKC